VHIVVDRATGPKNSPDKIFTTIAQVIPHAKPLNRPAKVFEFLGAIVAIAEITAAGIRYVQTAIERTEPK
jgi:hypothetical protein